MNTVEILRLINFLRNEVKDDQFELASWARDTNTGVDEKRTRCGTVGCAIGLAILNIPEWREQGFHLERTIRGTYFNPTYKDFYGFTAITKFLGITTRQAIQIFTSSGYPNGDEATRHQVADKLEKLVNTHQEIAA